MEIKYEFRSALPLPHDPLHEAILLLLGTALESPPNELMDDLTYHELRSPAQVWLASTDEKLVGCKLGYERKAGHYYSWMGGIHPNFRCQGIARELMRRQHAWCRQQSYHWIRTQTYNRWRAMLILNLREEFDVIGTVRGTHGLMIVLEKQLL